MLNTPNQVLLDMHSNSFQDYFLHHLLEGKCEADLPADPWILHLALLEDKRDIGFFQSSGNSSEHHGLSKMVLWT